MCNSNDINNGVNQVKMILLKYDDAGMACMISPGSLGTSHAGCTPDSSQPRSRKRACLCSSDTSGDDLSGVPPFPTLQQC